MSSPLVAMAQVTPSEIKNISAWRLNKAEMQELADRVKKGESEAEVKRELQTKKALACEERKRSAVAISSKGSTDHKPSAGSKSKKLPAKSATAVDLSKTDPTNASYYAEVEADLQSILKAFPGLDQEMPLCLSDSEKDGTKTGVQAPFELPKAQNALAIHGAYRCSIPVFWLQILSSPTPGVPMSRRRVLDMAEFYFPDGRPAFMTGRMVECVVEKASLTDRLSNLQMVSPEELVHSLVAACALAVRCLVCITIFGTGFNQKSPYFNHVTTVASGARMSCRTRNGRSGVRSGSPCF